MTGGLGLTIRPALSGAGARLVVDLGSPYRCISSAVLGGGLGWARTWLDLEVVRPYTRTDPEVHLLEEATDLPSPVVGMLTAARVARFQKATVGGAWSVATVGVGHALAAASTRPRSLPVEPAALGTDGRALAGSPAADQQRTQAAGPPAGDLPARSPAGDQQRTLAARPPAGDQQRTLAARSPAGDQQRTLTARPPAGDQPHTLPAAGTINLLVVVDEPLTDAGLVNALQTAVEAKAQALAAAMVPAANGAGYATGTATDSVCVACPPGERMPFAGPVTRVGAELALAVLEAVLSGAELDRAVRASTPGLPSGPTSPQRPALRANGSAGRR